MSNVNSLVYEAMANVSVPWRSFGSMKIQFGRTSMTDLPMDCLILNDLAVVTTLRPSFMFCLENFKLLENPGDGGNGMIVASTNAQSLEYKKLGEGKCEVITYFWGMPKKGRFLDWIYRLFEHGFRLKNFEGFNDLPFKEDAVIDISVKKSDYSHPGLLYGKLDKEKPFKVPARIRRFK